MSDKEKILIYENLLHRLQLHLEITMDNDKVSEILKSICDWSRAHRGEYTEEELEKRINDAFNKFI